MSGEDIIPDMYIIVVSSRPCSKHVDTSPTPHISSRSREPSNLLGGILRGLRAGELGHSLGTLEDGVLGELTREKQTNSVHDLPRSDGVALVGTGKVASLGGNAVKDIVDEGVHDLHGVLADEGVGVDRVEHLVDGGRVGRVVALPAGGLGGGLLLGGLSLCGAGCLLLLLSNSLRHFES